MQDIDFLPVEYFQRRVRRQARPWRIAVVTLCAALAAGAAAAQYFQQQRLQSEMHALIPAYQLAAAQDQQIAQMQTRLKNQQHTAELLAYLQHPWPRTQILRALLEDLPGQVVFEQLRIWRERLPTQPSAEVRLPSAERREDLSRVPPAERDLRSLREQYDSSQVHVKITGVTSDSTALHRWVSSLGKHRLFARAELTSIETAGQDNPQLMRFSAVALVAPGYGEPGSSGPPETSQLAGKTSGR